MMTVRRHSGYSLADPGAAGDLADDPLGAVPVQPPTVRGYEKRSAGALADGQVDRPGGTWRSARIYRLSSSSSGKKATWAVAQYSPGRAGTFRTLILLRA